MSRYTRHRCGVLLAGGANTRFGGVPKGLQPLGDVRMADHVLRALEACCDEVAVSANDADAQSWFPARRILRDATPGLGALGALETALHAAEDATIVVCAWDLPFVRAEVLDRLASVVDAGASCCVPQHDDGRVEPLCAAYDARLAPAVTAMVASGERAAQAVWRGCGGAVVPVSVLVPGGEGDGGRVFWNVNTPDDLRRAARTGGGGS